MHIKRLNSQKKLLAQIKALGVDGGGVKILSQKSKLYYFYITKLHVGAANILKQDALSIGADLAVPKGTIIAAQEYVDAILIANERQLLQLSKKELAQPFGLKTLAQTISQHVKQIKQDVEVMGVINANDDSFYAASRFKSDEVLEAIEAMIEAGADVIDIGAVSSRPNAPVVAQAEELARLKPITDLIQEHRLFERVRFSIDSYTPSVVKYALASGFSIINDITGFRDDRLCELCVEYNATAVIMHMQGTPQTMQDNPEYEDVIEEVDNFFSQQIEKLKSYGVNDIMLDVGIGFGKRLEDNLALTKHLSHFLYHGYPILYGASRKSMIDKIFTCKTEDRLAGTLALHLEAYQNGASMLRVHDVYEHKQAIAIAKTLA